MNKHNFSCTCYRVKGRLSKIFIGNVPSVFSNALVQRELERSVAERGAWRKEARFGAEWGTLCSVSAWDCLGASAAQGRADRRSRRSEHEAELGPRGPGAVARPGQLQDLLAADGAPPVVGERIRRGPYEPHPGEARPRQLHVRGGVGVGARLQEHRGLLRPARPLAAPPYESAQNDKAAPFIRDANAAPSAA